MNGAAEEAVQVPKVDDVKFDAVKSNVAVSQKGVKSCDAPQFPSEVQSKKVWLLFESNSLEQTVEDLCLLAQVQSTKMKEAESVREVLESKGLVITDCPGLVPQEMGSLPRVVVGTQLLREKEGSFAQNLAQNQKSNAGVIVDIELPGDEVSLVHLVEKWSQKEQRKKCVYLVIAWHGGGGVTTTAKRIAGQLDGVVLDASGNYGLQDHVIPGSDPVGLTWDDLDPTDLPSGAELLSALPRLEGVPVLTAARGTPVTPTFVGVQEVTKQVPCDVLVDCGTDVGQTLECRRKFELAGQTVRIILVGKPGKEHLGALARVLIELGDDVGNMPTVSLLLVGRPNDLFRTVVTRFPVRWRRAPKQTSTRGWAQISQDLKSSNEILK